MARISRAATAAQRARRNLCCTSGACRFGTKTGTATEWMLLARVAKHAQADSPNGIDGGFVKCVQAVMAGQPEGWDPCDPSTRFANDLHASIFDAMGLDAEDVRLYTAVGSVLDWRGVDCFILVKFPNQEKVAIVTIDISEREKTQCKADILIVAEDGEYTSSDYKRMVAKAAKEVTEKALEKKEQGKLYNL